MYSVYLKLKYKFRSTVIKAHTTYTVRHTYWEQEAKLCIAIFI